MREITDLDGDKGRITYKMAYQNDKPWVVVKEESPPAPIIRTPRPGSAGTTTVKLVLKHQDGEWPEQRSVGRRRQGDLRSRVQALNTAQAKVPKK